MFETHPCGYQLLLSLHLKIKKSLNTEGGIIETGESLKSVFEITLGRSVHVGLCLFRATKLCPFMHNYFKFFYIYFLLITAKYKEPV